MKKLVNLLLTPTVSHIAVAVAAAFMVWYWCGTHKEQAMKPHEKKFKVALLYSQQGYYHTNAHESFMKTAMRDSFFSDDCELRSYEPHAIEQLLINQLVQSILQDSPDLIVTFGALFSQAVTAAISSKGLKTPVIFVGVSNAVELGLLDSLDGASTNVTGIATAGDDSTLPYELFMYLKPNAKNILLPYFAGGVASTAHISAEKAKKYFAKHNVGVTLLPITTIGEAGKHVAGVLAEHDTVMFLEGDQVERARVALIQLCNRHQKTLFALDLAPVEQGAAIGYGVDPIIPGEVAVDMAKSILTGKKPANMPVNFLKNNRRLLINLDALARQDISIDPSLINILNVASTYQKEK